MTDNYNSFEDIDNALALISEVENDSHESKSSTKSNTIENNSKEYSYDKSKESSNKKDMEQIIDNFSKALNQVPHEDFSEDNQIKQIQDTTYDSTDESLNIGEYKISKNEDSTYSLYDEDGKLLIENNVLYETVYNIASYLYQGYSFNSMKILNLLKLNEKYEKFISDARLNKSKFQKYKKQNNKHKQQLEKTRFDENKSRAMSFKKPIVESYKKITKE